MDSLGWKDWTAIWGALTGTLGLLLQLFSKRPRFVWSPQQGAADKIVVRVYNPSAIPLLITQASFIGRGKPVMWGLLKNATGFLDYKGDDWLAAHNTGRLYVFVEPESFREIMVFPVKEGAKGIIVFWWHRFGLVPLRRPHLKWLSCRVVEDVNRGGASVPTK